MVNTTERKKEKNLFHRDYTYHVARIYDRIIKYFVICQRCAQIDSKSHNQNLPLNSSVIYKRSVMRQNR